MTPDLQQDNAAATVPMSEVLARIANELRVLAWTSDKLQDAISPVFLANGSADSSSIATLQSLDLMSQSISGIAQVVDALTRVDACQCAVDPAESCRGLTLSALAERIAGTRVKSAVAKPSDGQCNYFEDFTSESEEGCYPGVRAAC